MSGLTNPVKKTEKNDREESTMLCPDCQCKKMHVVIDREHPNVVQVRCSKCDKNVVGLCWPEE